MRGPHHAASANMALRPALWLLALMLALVPFAWATEARAQGALPPDSGKEIDDAMLPDENGPEKEGDGRDDNGDGKKSGDDEETGGGSEDDTATTEEPSGLGGIAVDFFNLIGTHIWDWSIGSLGEKIAADIGDALLYLPDPSSDEQVTGVYSEVKKVMQGLLVAGIIVMSLAMIVRSANTGLHFSGLKMLPRILGVAIVLGALPSLFGVLSTLGTDITAALMPNDEQIQQGKLEMTKAIASNLVISNFMNLILALAGIYVLFVLIVVAALKSVVYVLLFIIAAFPLIASLIPGFEKFAVTWAKAVLITAFIPAVWAAELWIGAVMIQMPEVLFGPIVNKLGFLTNGMFTTIIAIGMFYLMYKTPFIAMSWAIPSYEPSRGGGLLSFGKFAAATAASAGIKSAVGGAVAGFLGGGEKGSQSDAPKGPSDKLGGLMKENKRITKTTTTDAEGNSRTQTREEHTLDASRARNMEHDQTMNIFGSRDGDRYGPPGGGGAGPEGSPPPPKTQTVRSGGRGGRLPGGDRSRNDQGFNDTQRRSRDDQNVRDRGEEE